MSYNIKDLEKDVLKSTFLEKVNKVLLTINDDINNDPFTRLTEQQITMEERIYFAKHFKTDNSIYDYLKSSVILNKYIRVIYLNDISIDMPNVHVGSLIFNETSNEYVSVMTYFVGAHIKDDEVLTKKLVAILINTYIYELVGNELNQSVKFGLPEFGSELKNPIVEFDIAYKLLRIDATIISFKALDIIVDLKYSDFDSFIQNVYIPYIHYEKGEALRLIYNYAIETTHTADDYEDLIVKVFDLG